MSVTFHTKSIDFKLGKKHQHNRWVKFWIESRNAVCGNLTFVFTSNKQIKLINQKYLNHHYFTDVITFDYSEGNTISGDIFISIDEVRINSIRYRSEEDDELRRVMIHGVLHLLGYNDKSEEERLVMRKLENEALHLWLKMV